MKIAFIFSLTDSFAPRYPLESQQQMQFGISYISAVLKIHGHQTRLLVLSRETANAVDKFIEEFQPSLVCFTAVASEYPFIARIARKIKEKHPSIYLLAGGCHVSLNPEQAISDAFDAVCIGEGEYPTLELVKKLEKCKEPSTVANLWIKHKTEIEKNPSGAFLKDLDLIPFPDREMWQKWIYPASQTKHSILLGRGCPYLCTYCCNHALRKLQSGNYVRFRSPENILEELKRLVADFPKTEEVYLEVETFSANIKWAIEVCALLEKYNNVRSRPLSFGVNLRISPNINIEPLVAALKKANFTFVNIGLESGSERVRKEILNRNYSNQDVVRVVRLLKQHGLKINFFNLIGIPGETLEDFRETIRINRECQPDGNLLSIFFPYPGTDLYLRCKERKLLDMLPEKDIYMERMAAHLDLPEFPRRKIQRSYILFEWYAYLGHKPIYKILAYILRRKIHTSYSLNRFYRWLTRNSIVMRLKKFIA